MRSTSGVASPPRSWGLAQRGPCQTGCADPTFKAQNTALWGNAVGSFQSGAELYYVEVLARLLGWVREGARTTVAKAQQP